MCVGTEIKIISQKHISVIVVPKGEHNSSCISYVIISIFLHFNINRKSIKR